jgi:hypothetical protein
MPEQDRSVADTRRQRVLIAERPADLFLFVEQGGRTVEVHAAEHEQGSLAEGLLQSGIVAERATRAQTGSAVAA